MDFGTALIRRNDDGSMTVEHADDTIGLSGDLLERGGNGLTIDADGCILLANDPVYRYRPVRFEAAYVGAPVYVVAQRVREQVPAGGRVR